MKIIDDKGRLFGKINIIDFFVLLFILNLMPIFYFGYKIFLRQAVIGEILKEEEEVIPKDTDKSQITSKETVLKVDFINLDDEILERISSDAREVDSQGNIIAQIIELEKPNLETYELIISGEKKLVKGMFPSYHIFATLRLNVKEWKGNYYYKNAKIKQDNIFEFVTDKYRIKGQFKFPITLDVGSKNIDPLIPKSPWNTWDNYARLENLAYRVDAAEKKMDLIFQRKDVIPIEDYSQLGNLASKVADLEKKMDSILSVPNIKEYLIKEKGE